MTTNRDVALGAVRMLAAPTPLMHLPELNLWIKDERHLPTGSFKLRGAAAWLASNASTGPVFTGSSGNHAAALAWVLAATGSARRLTTVVTEEADRKKVGRLVNAGVEVVVVAGDNEVRDRAARALAAENGGAFCSSHDDAFVIAGQSTVAVEVMEARPETSTIVVPVGGGGLFAGTIMSTAHRAGVSVVGAEPSGANAMALSLAQGRRVRLSSVSTQCDALRAAVPGQSCLAIARASMAKVVEVPDAEIAEAQRLLAGLIGTVELSAAASVGAALRAGLSESVCIVTGGTISTPSSGHRLGE